MVTIYALLPLICAALSARADDAKPSQTSWKNTTGTSNVTFPTDVGFLGTIKYSDPPFLAQRDPLNTTEYNNNSAIELRFKPLHAKEDDATSADIYRNLGTTSPYHPANDLFPETEPYHVLPEQCKIKQVHILHRHGARNPTSSSHEGTPLFGQAIANASKDGSLHASGPLSFLNHWNYSIGSEILVHQGAKELFDSGVKQYYAYAKLLKNSSMDHKPVLRTTSQSRMLDSARYFSLGYFGWNAPEKINLEVITEKEGQNNTLASYDSCPNSVKDSYVLGDKLSSKWQEVYLKDAMERFQKDLKGVKLTPKLVYGMMSLCAYETVALGFSRFCPLFTKEEYENYEYDIDLQFQGDYGFMNPTGKAQGIGWVDEFLARVNKKPFKGPVSSQNTTLDYNSTYFPVDQPFYADFTHDDIILSVLTAFNFSQFADYLPTTNPDPSRRFRTSRIIPFGARLIFEVMDCDEDDKTTQYIRTKINDAIIPMDQNQGCEKRPDGLCKLQSFVSHQEKNAYKDANYQTVCFGKNGTDFVFTGPVTNGTVYVPSDN